MITLLSKLENIVSLNSTTAHIIAPLDAFQMSKITNKLPLTSFDNQLTALYKYCDGFSLGDLCWMCLMSLN